MAPQKGSWILMAGWGPAAPRDALPAPLCFIPAGDKASGTYHTLGGSRMAAQGRASLGSGQALWTRWLPCGGLPGREG